jgi:hypothetical protein
MNYLRNRSLKRLMSMGRRSNPDDDCVVVDPDSPPPPTPPTPGVTSGRWMEQRTMSYLGSRSLRRILSLGRRSSADEDCAAVAVVDAEPFPPPPCKPTWRCFSYEEVHRATNGFHPGMVTLKRLPDYALFVSPFLLNFALALLSLLDTNPAGIDVVTDNVVGRGGYGEVYCGILDDGRAVAVKRLAATAAVAADEKKEKDFLTELGTVGHVRHPNVSSLLGCCVDRGLHLVFEFSTRGSVSANLHGKSLPLRRHDDRLCFVPSNVLS